jgi:hypothetical protein
MTELLSMEAMKGTTGEDWCERLSATLERHKLSRNKLISVTTDGSPNLGDRNVGLLNMMQDIIYETCPNQEILYFSFSLYYSPRGTLQNIYKYESCHKHRCENCAFYTSKWSEPQIVPILIEDMDAERTDIPYHSNN